uniref:Peptidase A1 domain-containing protein n=1 Tax=Ditylenchus dipsaci TaxID=166011 RepID=A0A915DR09_9BILA
MILIALNRAHACYFPYSFSSIWSARFTIYGAIFCYLLGGLTAVCGQVYTDHLRIGVLYDSSQTFLSVNKTRRHIYNTPMDGILGLAWPNLMVGPGVPPIQSFVGQLSEESFTLFENCGLGIAVGPLISHLTPSTPSGTIGGLISYGSKDYRNCDPAWTHTPILLGSEGDAYYWEFNTSNFAIGNEEARQVNGVAVIFYPDPNIYVIYEMWSKILKITAAKYSSSLGVYAVDCSKISQLPDITFTISGQQFAVPSYQYINKIPGEDQNCKLSVDVSYMGKYLLGAPFLRTYCTYFDFSSKRLCFSRARHPNLIY